MLMPDTCKCEYFVLVSPTLKQVYNSLEGLTQCEAKLMRHKIKNKCLQNGIKLQQNSRFPLVKKFFFKLPGQSGHTYSLHARGSTPMRAHIC